MSVRSFVRHFVAVVTALMLWQAGFAAPAPVAADGPPPGYIDCGNGLICGDGGTGPGSDIEVTGPEDHIVQTDADVQWGFIENEAKAVTSAVHGIPDDSQLTDWGRDELRAYMLDRLIGIAAKPAAQRTDQEQAALTKYEHLVKQKQQEAAQNAVDLYNDWDADPCNFYWPADVSNNPNLYHDQVDVQAWCTDPEGAGLAGRPASPTDGDFTGMGTAMAFKTIATDPDGARVQNEITAGVTFFGAFAATAIGVAVGAAILSSSAAVISAVGGALLSTFTGLIAVDGAFVATTAVGAAASWGAATAGGAASTIAGAVAGPVAIVVFALIIIAVGIWEQVVQADVPKNLHAALDHYNLPDCSPVLSIGCYTPDINAMAQDTSGAGYFTLQSVFIEQTLPDYSNRRTNNPAAHGADDPVFFVMQHTAGLPDVPLGVVNSITPADWNSLIPLPQTAYIAGGWWVNDTATDPPTYHLTIPYVAPDGTKWQAGTTKIKVAATDLIPEHLEPGLILEKEGDQQNSVMLKPGDSFDFKGAANGVTYTATLIAPSQNWAPLVNPQVSGDLVEGGTVTFHANAVDANGDALTNTWWIEPGGGGPALLIIGSDGKSQIDHCYTDPITADNDFLLNCPWDTRTGSDPTYTYHDSGDLHVHLITTDGHGGTATQVFQVHINNVAPAVTMDYPGTTFSIDEGGSVDLPGSFNDAGDDQVAVSVDWGDGTSDTQHFPCYFGVGVDIPQGCTLHFPAEPAGHPQAFDFKHTYPDDPPGSTTAYGITLTATDDDGGVTSKTFSATVGDVAPQLTLGCGLTSDPGLGGNTFGCQTRYGNAPFSVPLNGFFDDPGADTWKLDVNWGDGDTDHFTYPCANGDPCPFQTDSDVFLYLGQTGRTFINASHQYTTPGNYTIQASVDDGDGGTDSQTASAAISSAPVDNLPTATITTPADGAVYTLNQSVTADYSCSDDHGVAACTGPVADGAAVDTSSLGQHTFTVFTTDDNLQSNSATVHYTVENAPPVDAHPTATITTPVNGAVYQVGQVIKAAFACHDDNTVATCIGSVAVGANINTATVGSHTLTVTATDDAAQTGSATTHYTVVYPFALRGGLVAPPATNHAKAGSKVKVWFSIGASHGQGVFRAPAQYQLINCATHAGVGSWVKANLSGPAYSKAKGLYYIVWTTYPFWATQCRQLVLKLADGTNKTLYFHFD